MEDFNVLTTSAEQLAKLLDSQRLTSEALVEQYFAQIARHNHEGLNLRAIIATAPRDRTLDVARKLDRERKEKGPRGPLHGIPIIVKDVFFTPSLELATTLGSAAFKDATGPRDADVIQLLLEAGVIILGKTNLSEFGNYKGNGFKPGWSTPAGSSAGSAVGVAAGFAALAISTETDGSTVQPATRAALYGLKGTLGSVPTWGSQPITDVLDSIGGMAKTATDLANLFGVLQEKDYTGSLNSSCEGIKLGFVDPELWQPASFVVEPVPEFTEQTLQAYASAVETIRSKGAKVAKNVPLITMPEVFEGLDGVDDTEVFMDADFNQAFTAFLQGYANSDIKSLADLVKWIDEHADVELPEGTDQAYLKDALANNMSRDKFDAALNHMRERSRNSILKTLAEHDVDVILGPADARMASVAACAGYPIASVPLGFADFNGRAFGLNVLAPAGAEDKILRVMSAWEATFPEGRTPPPQLVDWTSETKSGPQL
ncbi:hypothetical protein N0V90_007258 [Kalmusia sp. IMI 367209]|nr:hypothetical protein N0V90_007258 [Kalmusia sp. IMI 367209]